MKGVDRMYCARITPEDRLRRSQGKLKKNREKLREWIEELSGDKSPEICWLRLRMCWLYRDIGERISRNEAKLLAADIPGNMELMVEKAFVRAVIKDDRDPERSEADGYKKTDAGKVPGADGGTEEGNQQEPCKHRAGGRRGDLLGDDGSDVPDNPGYAARHGKRRRAGDGWEELRDWQAELMRKEDWEDE